MAATRRGSWSVTAVNGLVAGTVLVLVAVLALVVNPPAPPGIAAFAPQATKPIDKAPDNQSAQFGSGVGQCGAGQVCSGPSATPSASASASTAGPSASPTPLRGALPPGLQCYEWPSGVVTQTFDPQSPPCVSRWDDAKGNGGATSPGVTATEIRVALPQHGSQSGWPTLKPIVDFFNSRYQLYGRKITIVPFTSQQAEGNLTGSWNNPTSQKADAAAVGALNVFASLDFLDPIHSSWSLPVWMDDLAKKKIISINGGETTPAGTAAALRKRAPYAWSYYPTVDQLMDNVATVVCRQLVGKRATHSTDATIRGKQRKFAFFLPGDARLGGPMPGLSSALRILDACGVKEPKVVRSATGASNVAANSASFSQLQRDGVTSVILFPFGGNGQPGSPLLAAQQVGYQPEWVVIGWNNYNTAFMLHDPASQTGGAFGVGMWNKQPQLSLEPWHQALLAAGATSDQAAVNGRSFYQELQLLASGIQMAGPALTPETFAKGLEGTDFPNPGGGRAPFYQGTVGFQTGDATMVDDFTAFWLDTRQSGQNVQNSQAINQEKALCLVALGRRWRLDTWPSVDGFYRPGPCR